MEIVRDHTVPILQMAGNTLTISYPAVHCQNDRPANFFCPGKAGWDKQLDRSSGHSSGGDSSAEMLLKINENNMIKR